MRTKGLIALGGLGAFLFAASSKASIAPALPVAAPPAPPPPPPVNPRAGPLPSQSSPPVVHVTPPPTAFVPPPKVTPVPSNTPPFVPTPPIHDVMVPAGWIAAMPTAELSAAAHAMQVLGDPAGTIYPFQLGGKNYAAIVALDHTIAIIQPDNQL